MTRRLRSGFTLTELLVVTAIMASLLGIVLAGARPSKGVAGDIRRGAQELASLLLSSQSDSLGSPTGAGVIIESQGTAAEVISHARRYPFIEGTVAAGTIFSATASQQSIRLTPTNDVADALVHGYRIRFLDRTSDTHGPASDWFSFACSAPPTATVAFRADNGQSARTTIWPTMPVSGTLSFQVARYPIPTGGVKVLPKGVAIDLRHSGYGDTAVTSWGSLANRGAIAVGFDSVGSVDTLMQNVLPSSAVTRTVQPISPAEEVYLFVTSRSEIDTPSINTLASDKAVWVVIHPKSGRITVSANVPQRGTDTAALWAAREKARKGITLGG